MKIKRLTPAEVEYEVILTNTDIDIICKAIAELGSHSGLDLDHANSIRAQFRNHVVRGGQPVVRDTYPRG